MRKIELMAVLVVLLSWCPCVLAEEKPGKPYTQVKDVVYGEVHGTGLLMDVFTPAGKANGRAIVDVASGAWFSDRGKIRDHEKAQVYDILCGRGYCVFAIRPGSRTKYTFQEMDENVKLGIRYVKDVAEQYGFDHTKLGLTGASAGGHLATLAALTPVESDPRAKNELERKFDTHVAAVAVFFPPTDFLEWKPGDKVNRAILGYMLTGRGQGETMQVKDMSMDELTNLAREVSPLHRVEKPKIPFLTIHGDADPVVHVSQSEKLVSAIRAAGGSADLIIKAGGGHPWPTIAEEVTVTADWFDKTLK
jgi:acetyl esterase/lipase